MRFSPGAALGPYTITGPIGAGGMGEVYRALDTRLGRDVAVKVLPRELTTNRDRLTRFEREARSASALNHPHIVTIHDFADAGDERYLVMELIVGESLRDLISRGPVPIKKAIAIASGIADGLAAAHAAGVIHRDLKPENVMMTREGTPKILDFGLAKNAPAASIADDETDVKVTRTGMLLGTATYMAPEQARGESVGIQADQFALGLILYEMIRGQHPFRRPNSYETVTAILNDEPPPFGDNVPEPLIWIIERCLAKEASGRYASTIDLARDLALLRDRSSSYAGPARARNATSARPVWLVAALAAAGVAALAAAIIVATRNGGEGIADPLQLAVPTPQIDVLMSEVAVPVAISPDGAKLIASGTGANGTIDLWLHDLRSGAARLLVENAFAPAWSSDGTAIAFFADGKLKTIPVDGGPPTIVCDAPPEGSPAWSGDSILFVRYSGGPANAGLYQVKAAGGTPRRVGAPGSVAMWPHVLPDGNRLLYVVINLQPDAPRRIEQQLKLGSLDGSTPTTIDGVNTRAVYADGHLLYVRDGTLLAQPFDLENARLTGDAVPVVDNVHYFRSTGMASFSVSANGILVWRAPRRPARLAWLDRTGVELSTVGTALFDRDGRLSPDGTRYAVGVFDASQGIADVWLYDLVRQSAERFTFDRLDQKAPVWSRDGQTIYHRTDGFSGPPDIVQRKVGEEVSTTFFKGPAVEHPEDISPDGKWLLFTTYMHITNDIHVLPLDPRGPPRPFATTPFDETSPRFSPDGEWVAYSSNVSGTSEIYARPFNATAPAVRVSKDGGVRPRWSRDGKELFFLGPAGRLMTVPFDGSFGTPRMLFQAASAVSFEPGPDSRRFLVHLEERASEPPVRVLVNWPARVKR